MGQFWPKVEDDLSSDNTGLFSTTVTLEAYKAIEFGEIKQNKGYNVVQDHSRLPVLVLIERVYATSY